MEKLIKNVTLSKIRKVDGAMLFTWDKEHPTLGKSLWITGDNRPLNTKCGMTGKLEYKKFSGGSLWWFSNTKICTKNPAGCILELYSECSSCNYYCLA